MNEGSECMGVDLNRNFDDHWGSECAHLANMRRQPNVVLKLNVEPMFVQC